MARPRITVSNRRFVIVVLVAAAGVAWGGYALDNRFQRVGLSLALLAPVIWGAAGLSVVEHLTTKRAARPHERRFMQLRSVVDQMLSEIRRLNWAVFDQERHVRNENALKKELDAMEERLIALVKEVRNVAGQARPEDRGVASK